MHGEPPSLPSVGRPVLSPCSAGTMATRAVQPGDISPVGRPTAAGIYLREECMVPRVPFSLIEMQTGPGRDWRWSKAALASSSQLSESAQRRRSLDWNGFLNMCSDFGIAVLLSRNFIGFQYIIIVVLANADHANIDDLHKVNYHISIVHIWRSSSLSKKHAVSMEVKPGVIRKKAWQYDSRRLVRNSDNNYSLELLFSLRETNLS